MSNIKNYLKKLPQDPGIYRFFDVDGNTIYIGKAINLKNRVKSYFQNNIGVFGAKATMIPQITKIKWQITSSEAEALILEANLVKKHQPKFNVLLRDDKTYFYVAITKENFPKIKIIHKNQIRNSQSVIRNFVGPFTDGTALRQTLKLLRQAFPFCTCKTPHKRPCLNYQIGKCTGICCTQNPKFWHFKTTPTEYRKNIKRIIKVLLGEKSEIAEQLELEMKKASQKHQFELAAKLRDQLWQLENIFSHRQVVRDETRIERGLVELANILKIETPKRIEAYDISNIQGKHAVGSMVVFTNGQPDKSQYRKFKIKTITGANDVWMLKEIVSRRLRHKEWPTPNLLLIDGGQAQLNIAQLALKQIKLNLPVISLAKKEEIIHTPQKPINLKKDSPALQILQQARDEAHRFAISYHKKLRNKVV